VLDAISSPRRRQILRLVWVRERTAGEIASRFDVSWPAISQNLRILRRAGLISERREGTRRWYRAEHQALGSLRAVLTEMWERDLDAIEIAMRNERGRG
jgi:DNA-binding transcriptional ArsR family regulator